jgi:hypothetical protein
LENRIRSCDAGRAAFRDAIREGRVIDHDRETTIETLRAEDLAEQQRVMRSRLMQLAAHRRGLMSIGIGKCGTVRPSIAREIAKIDAEEKSILNALGS